MTSSAGFFRGLGIARHVVADDGLHQLAHEAVDGATRGGEALEDVGAGIIFIEGAQDAFELADDFLVRLTRSSFWRDVCDILLAHPMGVLASRVKAF